MNRIIEARKWERRAKAMEGKDGEAWLKATEAAKFFRSLWQNGDLFYIGADVRIGETVKRFIRGFQINYGWIYEDFQFSETLGLNIFQAGSVAMDDLADTMMSDWENKYNN